eukprot:CAMPEP_0184691534 /NCGR_PEP_ID=MMETSP0313-20130426/363_1 /TAXON_ID=2792 /ORGANISM="Porphyridium aerugineum, Strain SAG 1380-2" /LENGTH=223 /DNA_ID=CAMNT_0027149275 /DNA_START=266 /DNA_END=937 /DNA_ORIENTATION=+
MSTSTKEDNRIVNGPYQGKFGSWYLTEADEKEVQLYRKSLTVGASALCLGMLPAFVPNLDANLAAWWTDACFIAGVASLFVSLQTIHIYMKPLHNALKAVYGAGVAGSLITALTHSGHMISVAETEPLSLLATGWIFVACTGLFFKENICFAKWESLGLTLLTPVLCLGHFFGWLPKEAEQALLGAIGASAVIFILSKFKMPVTSDLGDKSVFEYLASQKQDA